MGTPVMPHPIGVLRKGYFTVGLDATFPKRREIMEVTRIVLCKGFVAFSARWRLSNCAEQASCWFLPVLARSPFSGRPFELGYPREPQRGQSRIWSNASQSVLPLAA
jgi:hypothetical protein